MGKLASLTAFANKEAAKLGLDVQLRVCLTSEPQVNGKKCSLRGRTIAHAHCSPHDQDFGRICIRRNGWSIREWHDTMRHEVAHFAPGGNGHGVGFLRTRAKQGSVSAKNYLIRSGRERCTRHVWNRGRELERKSDYRGLTIRYEQECAVCRKVRPERKTT